MCHSTNVYVHKICQSESGGAGHAQCNMCTSCDECTYTWACTYSVKRWHLDATIYNNITSILNLIRLKLFTLISIVNKIMYSNTI